ncbi:MAG TPA: VOC family protein [Burkholderiales bacterium]|nr:VOC family protein [Burkholderiales bacterium]
MTHRSRLSTIVIDCRTGDLDRATEFWAAALGAPMRRFDQADAQNYRQLEMPGDQVAVVTQEVDHPSRVHLDIETDDLDAEVARLEKLGAKRIAFVKRWWVMEAPTGQRFCVVRPQRPDFPKGANEWP